MNKYKECNQCPHEFNDKNLEPCKDCVPKKKTNADRIRAMSDEELAKFLSMCVSDCQGRKLEQKEFCEGCPFNSRVGYCTDKHIKKWLQSEAE